MAQTRFAWYEGDKFIAVGTAEELAEKMGVQVRTIRYLATPTHHRRLALPHRPTGHAKYTIRLDDDEED